MKLETPTFFAFLALQLATSGALAQVVPQPGGAGGSGGVISQPGTNQGSGGAGGVISQPGTNQGSGGAGGVISQPGTNQGSGGAGSVISQPGTNQGSGGAGGVISQPDTNGASGTASCPGVVQLCRCDPPGPDQCVDDEVVDADGTLYRKKCSKCYHNSKGTNPPGPTPKTHKECMAACASTLYPGANWLASGVCVCKPDLPATVYEDADGSCLASFQPF